MRFGWMVKIAVIMLGVGSVVPVLAADADRLMGHSRAAVEATLPALPKDQLDLLVYRLPTFQQTMNKAEPTSAAAVNPYGLLDLTREQLALRYPSLADTELDKLVFKIADINSMRTLPVATK